MKAIVQDSFGGNDKLEYREVDTPTPGAGEVLVKVAAAALNPFEIYIREGLALSELVKLPYIQGSDLAGTVEAVGDGVDFTVGQRVFGLLSHVDGGAFAEYAVVSADSLLPVPDELSDAEAAGLLTTGLTAWQGLNDAVHLSAGDKVLINGAGGGVGHLAVQIAAAAGAEVTAIAGTSKHEWLRELGAKETVDYNDAEAMAALEGFDVAFNLATGSLKPTLKAVKRGGDLITVTAGADQLEEPAKAAGINHHTFSMTPRNEWLQALVDLVKKGQLRVVVDSTFPLEQTADAFRELEQGHARGKIVLTVN